MYERLSTSAWATRPPTGVSTARASSDSSIPCQSSTSSSTVIPERSPTASWQAAMRFATALRRRWWASGRSSPLGPPGETPLVRGPEYGERVLCLVAEVPGYVLQILYRHANIGEAAREPELIDEAGYPPGRILADGLLEPPPAILGRLASRHREARREGDAGGVAVGYAVARPDPASQPVRESHRGVERPEVREPAGDLKLTTRLDVLGVLPGAGQVGDKAARPFGPRHVGDGVLPAVEQPLDRVVEGPYPGREPELLGREERSLGVEHHHLRDGLGVREAALAPGGLVGHPHAVRPLSPRERRRHGDVRRVAKPPRDGLGPAHHAPTPDAHQEVRALRFSGGFLDRATGGVLAHPWEGTSVLLAEQRLDAPHEIRLLVQRASGNDEGPVFGPGLLFYLLQAAEPEVHALRREKNMGPGVLHAIFGSSDVAAMFGILPQHKPLGLCPGLQHHASLAGSALHAPDDRSPLTLYRSGDVSIQRAIEPSQKLVELSLRLVGESGEPLGDHRLLSWDDLLEQSPSLERQEEAVGAALLAAGDQTAILELAHELAHVSLGHQKGIRELLLRHALARPHMRQHVELRDADPPRPHVLGRSTVDLLVDPHEP